MDPSANFGKRRSAEPSAPVAAYTPEPLVLPRGVPAAGGSSFLFPALGIFALLAVVFTAGLMYLMPARSTQAAPANTQIASAQPDLMPDSALPGSVDAGVERSSEFVTRYPRDPRAHMLHAIHFLHRHDFADAEEQIRTAQSQLGSVADQMPPGFQRDLNLTLALILIPQGRAQEARDIAAKDCGYAANGSTMPGLYDMLKTYKVCA